MKRILFFITVLTFTFFVTAQENVVTWTTKYNAKTSEIEINAKLMDGWHIYSQFVEAEFGPIPTSFTFDENAAFTLLGNVNEPKATHDFDPNFEASLDFFENEVTFKQKIKTTQTTTLNGVITYMACNEVQCIPPSDTRISIKITK